MTQWHNIKADEPGRDSLIGISANGRGWRIYRMNETRERYMVVGICHNPDILMASSLDEVSKRLEQITSPYDPSRPSIREDIH